MHFYRVRLKWLPCSLSPLPSASRSRITECRGAYKIAPVTARGNTTSAPRLGSIGWLQNGKPNDLFSNNLAIVYYPDTLLHRGTRIRHGIQRFNHEAAKRMAPALARGGWTVPAGTRHPWLTYNPAKSLGLEDRIARSRRQGTDVVIWNGTLQRLRARRAVFQRRRTQPSIAPPY